MNRADKRKTSKRRNVETSKSKRVEQSRVLSGFLAIDKPIGMSSMKAVSIVRRRAGGVKTGHAGTLDPLATGVLLVACGKATKLLARFTGLDKRYETEIDLSAFTATDDAEGEREDVTVKHPPTLDDLNHILKDFIGIIEQQPPAFSAVKFEGRRAYKLARKGQEIELSPRSIPVYEIDVLSFEWPIARIHIHCAKGFYVRRFARDLGIALGTGGYCRSIRRTAVGPFTLDAACELEALPDTLTTDDIMSIDTAIEQIESYRSPG